MPYIWKALQFQTASYSLKFFFVLKQVNFNCRSESRLDKDFLNFRVTTSYPCLSSIYIYSVFVVQFNGFMSLTSYLDVKYRY